jgi:putative peptidoglycan lipid II flippase
MGAVRLTWIIMTNAASRLGEGNVSALSYAYSIWQFPESLIGTAIALAAFPRLSVLASENKNDALRATYRVALVSILGLAIPATLVLVIFAQPIVALFLQRGAFGGTSTELVAVVLQFYALAVIGESLLELTSRIFYAQRDARTPMFIALVSMAIRAGLIGWWSHPFGAAGIALAYAIGVLLEGGLLYWIARTRMRQTSSY